LNLRVCDNPNPLRERGIELLRLTQCLEKSLAHASGYDNPLCFRAVDLPQSGTAQLQKLTGDPFQDVTSCENIFVAPSED
jgi:hypothetical protein